MKAWKVRDPNEWTATIVFAETAGKARSLAMHTDCCEDMDFCAIEVRRAPAEIRMTAQTKLLMICQETGVLGGIGSFPVL